MRDQTTEQEKVLLQIRNVFFWYTKVQVSVRIWSSTTRCAVLADIRDRKERGQDQCMRVHPRYRKKHGFCRMFSWLRFFFLALRYGNLRIATQHFKWSFARRQKNGVPKWCIEKSTHFYENYQKNTRKSSETVMILNPSWNRSKASLRAQQIGSNDVVHLIFKDGGRSV